MGHGNPCGLSGHGNPCGLNFEHYVYVRRMPGAIHNFTTNLIAFSRPKKHTYYALRWDDVSRRWTWWDGTVEGPLSKHKSDMHNEPGYVGIKLSTSGSMVVCCSGEFLVFGTTRITIVKRIEGAQIPSSWKNHDFGNVVVVEPVIQAVRLWDPPPAVAPVAAPPAPVTSPLPKRIAWLVAEDAAKKDEKCPITMEPISPITASVTSCFHTFDSDAITSWLANHTTCPQCRKTCVVTAAFSEA